MGAAAVAERVAPLTPDLWADVICIVDGMYDNPDGPPVLLGTPPDPLDAELAMKRELPHVVEVASRSGALAARREVFGPTRRTGGHTKQYAAGRRGA